MKFPNLVHFFKLSILLVGANVVFSQDMHNYDETYAAWEKAAFEKEAKLSILENYKALQKSWKAIPEADQNKSAYYFAQAAIKTAVKLVELGDYANASSTLGEAGEVARSHSIVISRGKSQIRFQELASVHATIVASTGTDPLKDSPIGYQLVPIGQAFAAIQEGGPGDNSKLENTAPEDSLKEGETEGTMIMLSTTGKIFGTHPVSLRKGDGETLRDRITGVYSAQASEEGSPARFTRAAAEVFFRDPALKRPERLPEEKPKSPDSSKSSPPPGTEILISEKPTRHKSNHLFWIVPILALAFVGWFFIKRKQTP